MTTHEPAVPPPAAAAGGLTPAAWRTIAACTAGYALNAMDALLLTPALAAMKEHVTDVNSTLIGTATLLSSALGGWVVGWLSDRFGRAFALQCTIAWFALFTGLCGFAPDYSWLFVCRALMGIGFGGTWAATAVMVAEASSPACRGWWVGVMQAGWAGGWFAALIVLPPLLNSLPNDVAWRAFFWFGGALPLALLIPYILYRLKIYLFFSKESLPVEASQTPAPPLEIFPDSWKKYIAACREFYWFGGALPLLLLIPYILYDYRFVRKESLPFTDTRKKAAPLEIFAPTMGWTTFLTCMLSIGAHGGYYVIMSWLPRFLVERDHDHTLQLDRWYLIILIVGSLFGYLVSGWFSDLDRFKRRGTFTVFAIGAILTVLAHFCFLNEWIIWALAFPLGFFASGTFSGMGAFFSELFPAHMRGSGAGFAYNFGRGFTVLILALVGAGIWPLGLSIVLFVLLTYGLVIIAAWHLPETRGEPLDSAAEDPVDEASGIVPGTRPARI
jgi:MFS family permease